MTTRVDLEFEYQRLTLLVEKAGGQPVVTGAVLDCFTDLELGLLIKDTALHLVQLRRLEA